MPLDFIVRFRCDQPDCCESNEMGHVTAPQQMPVVVEHFGIKEQPPGWGLSDGKVYCPQHATRLVKPSPLSIAALRGH